jgi:hypothetical protein
MKEEEDDFEEIRKLYGNSQRDIKLIVDNFKESEFTSDENNLLGGKGNNYFGRHRDNEYDNNYTGFFNSKYNNQNDINENNINKSVDLKNSENKNILDKEEEGYSSEEINNINDNLNLLLKKCTKKNSDIINYINQLEKFFKNLKKLTVEKIKKQIIMLIIYIKVQKMQEC